MKNKLRRLPKWLRLALLLALSGLLVFCMWLEARRPALSPQGALRQAEQAGLLEYGEFLTCKYTFPEHGETRADYHVAVSRTKTQLHTAEVQRDGLLWRPNNRVFSAPVEDPVTFFPLPWAINIENNTTAYPAIFVYCPQLEAARIEGTLHLQGKAFHSIVSGGGENGCWLVAFEGLHDEDVDHDLYGLHRELWSWRYFHMPLYTPVTATITILDQNGSILAEKTLEYS